MTSPDNSYVPASQLMAARLIGEAFERQRDEARAELTRLRAELADAQAAKRRALAIADERSIENAALRQERDELVEAIEHVRPIIAEASMTGFNCHDGDWAERLFASQAKTHAALSRIRESGTKEATLIAAERDNEGK